MFWWLWLFIIPFAFIGLVLVVLLLSAFLDPLVSRMKDMSYNRRARLHNKHALSLRLAKDSWNGIPLPTGKQGSLRITEKMMVQNPFSTRQIEKQLLDRAQDLGVDISIRRDALSYDYIVEWNKPKKKKNPTFVHLR